MSNVRSQFHNSIRSIQGYTSETMKVRSETERFNDALERGKVTMTKAITQRRLINNLIREQYQLQRASAVEWSRDARGRITGDLITPQMTRAQTQRMSSLRNIWTDASKGVISFNEAVDNSRLRLGTWSNVVAQASTNMVNWGKNMQWAGRQLTVGFTMPLGMFGAATGAIAYQADKELTRINKVYDTYSKTAAGRDRELAQLRQDSFSVAETAAKQYAVSLGDVLKIEGELAATGERGPGLQQAALETSRLMTLGELDYQEAVQATITLQNVYGMNTKQLGNAFNYMNMVENQTSLGIQDFAEAIPRVAGPLKELGIGVKEIGLLMTTMKSRGIDAGEGANALKSGLNRLLNPSKEVVKELKGFDININQIVESSGGNMLQVLMELSDQMRDMDKLSRQRIIGNLFGTYQFGRVNAILQGLEDIGKEGTQVDRAFKAMSLSNEQLAKSAETEMKRFQASASMKFMAAVRALQVELAKIGQVFLEYGDDIVNVATGIAKFFNEMPTWAKHAGLLVAALTALAGPLLMLVGLSANLTGQGIRFFATLGKIALGWKAVNREQVLAQKVGDAVGMEMMDETKSALALDAALRRLAATTAALRTGNSTLANSIQAGMIGPQNVKYTGQGQAYWAAGTMMGVGPTARNVGGQRISAADLGAMKMMESSSAQVAANAQKTAGAWKITAGKVAAVVGAASFMTSMFTDSGTMANNIASALLMLSFFPGVFSKMGTMFAALGSKISGVFGRVAGSGGVFGKIATSAKTTAMSAGAAFATMGAGTLTAFAGVAAAIVAAYVLVQHEIAQTREEVDKANDSADDFADTLGFTYLQAGERIDATGEKVTDLQGKIDKLAESNPELIASLQMDGKDMGEKWAAAINEGVKVRMHGGSAEAAEEAARIAMAIMGERFTKKEFHVRIKPRIDFSDTYSTLRGQVNNIADTIESAIEGRFDKETGWMETATRALLGSTDLTSAAKQEANDAGEELWNAWYQGSKTQKDWVMTQTQREMDTDFNQLYQKFKTNANRFGIKSGKELQIALMSGAVSPEAIGGLGTEDRALVRNTVAAWKELFKGINDAAKGGLSDEDIWRAKTMRDILVQIGAIQPPKPPRGPNPFTDLFEGDIIATGGTIDWFGDVSDKAGKKLDALAQSGKAYTYSSETQRGKTVETTEATEDLGDATEDTGNKMEDADHKAEKWQRRLDKIKERAQEIADRRRAVFEGTMDFAFDRASQIMEDQQAATMEHLEAGFQRTLDRLDRAAERKQAEFDRRQERQDNRFERQNRQFEAEWQKRTERVEAGYDRRIEKINDASEAEQRAEDRRQRIFEAEVRRIERLAELANQRIDFNVALNTGQLDEAAKIMNDIQGAHEKNAIEGVADRSQRVSDRRVHTLEDEADLLEKRKQMRLKNLEDIQEAEQRALERRQEAQRKALENEREQYERHVERRRKQIEKRLEYERDALEKEQQADRDSLEMRLDALKAFVPRDRAELRDHISRVENLYSKYGVDLKKAGNGWAASIAQSLTQHMRTSRAEVANDQRWASTAAAIANKLSQGAFGMNIKEFMAWIKTGNLPNKYKPGKAGGGAANTAGGGRGNMTRQQMRNARNDVGPIRSQHVGGWAGQTDKRTGYPVGGGQFRNEMLINAERGEFIVNKKAAAANAPLLDAINSGKGNYGWGGIGTISPLMAGLVGGMKQAMSNQIQASGQAAMSAISGEYAAGKAGEYGGRYFGKEQLRNAAIIANVGSNMHMSARDIMIGIMTAITESGLINVKYGDRDSLGLFQQRPSQGWGSAKQVTDPEYAAKHFFLALKKIRDRESLSPWMAAQSVQRSGTADGSNYRPYWDDAQGIFKRGLKMSEGVISGGHQYPGVEPVKPWVREAAEYLGALFNIKTIGGYRPTSAVANSDHPKGLALDLMVPNFAKGNAIAEKVMDMWRELDITYMIWRQRIKTNPRGPWERMEDRGSPTANHMDHVHLSFEKAGDLDGLLSSGQAGEMAMGSGGRHKPVKGGHISQGIHDSYTGFPAVDIGVPVGRPVYAAHDGRIAISRDLRGSDGRVSNGGYYSYGRYIQIDGGNADTLYAHLSQRFARQGQHVKGGTIIGKSGNTGHSFGPHLHFGARGASPYNFIQLQRGADIKYDNVVANLHKGEKVLAPPVSKSLEDGIANMDRMGGNQYNVKVEFNGPVNSDIDVQKAVEKAIDNVERRKGRNRKIT